MSEGLSDCDVVQAAGAWNDRKDYKIFRLSSCPQKKISSNKQGNSSSFLKNRKKNAICKKFQQRRPLKKLTRRYSPLKYNKKKYVSCLNRKTLQRKKQKKYGPDSQRTVRPYILHHNAYNIARVRPPQTLCHGCSTRGQVQG